MEDNTPSPQLDEQSFMDMLQNKLDVLLLVEQAQERNTTPSGPIDSTTQSEDNQGTCNVHEPQDMQSQNKLDFKNLIGDLASIRAATNLPSFGINALPTSPEPPPRSPIRQHPYFLPSRDQYKSPFQPQASQAPEIPIEFRLLQKFIENLPLDKPSPFTTEIFVESPLVNRKLVQKPVSFKEYDENGSVTRWVEMGLVLEDPPQHRRHCVVAGTPQVAVHNIEGQNFVDGDCAIWTRKYPEGWKGFHKNEAGELVDIVRVNTGPNTVWCFSAAATVILEGVERGIECAVPKGLVNIEGMQYEAEPSWNDVVRCLRKAILIWPRPMTEEALIDENTASPKESPRRTREAPRTSKVAQQTQSMNNVSGQSMQTREATEVATPPSTARGRKRKNKTGVSTPAKRTTAKTNTAGTKTPAKRRASANANIPAEPSQEKEDCEHGESTGTMQDRAVMAPTQFGPNLSSAYQNPSLQFGPNLSSAYPNHMSRPVGNYQTGPMTMPIPPAGGFVANRYVPSPQPSIEQRVLALFDERRELWRILSEPGLVNNDPLRLQRAQERLNQLEFEQTYLLKLNVPRGSEQ